MAFRLCSYALISADMLSGCVLILATTLPLYYSHIAHRWAYKSSEALQSHALDLSHAVRYRLAMLGSLCRDVKPYAHARKTVKLLVSDFRIMQRTLPPVSVHSQYDPHFANSHAAAARL